MLRQQARPLIFSYTDYQLHASTLEGLYIGEYTVLNELGRGSFGKVYRAANQTGTLFALKLLDKKLAREEPDQQLKQIRQRHLQSQPRLMRQCNSPNLIKCLDIFENEDLKILILEYCDGRPLSEELKRRKRLSQREAVDILRHIINGIAELHRHSIVHRDLKTDNIMRHAGIYKIIDFGFSKKLLLAHEYQKTNNTILGTPTTMAPEIVLRKNYGLKADIWSIGIIFFEMVFGIQPYDSSNAQTFFYKIEKSFSLSERFLLRGVILSVQAHDFLRKVLRVNPDQRLGWREMIEHPLIKIKEEQPITNTFLQRNKLEQPLVAAQLREGSLLYRQLEFQPTAAQQQHSRSKSKFDLDKVIEEQKEASLLRKVSQRKSLYLLTQKSHQVPITFKSQQQYIQKEAEHKEYKKCLALHLQCLKTELIYRQIFEPIESRGLIDLSRRESVQFMHLLISRCFKNLSPLKERLKNNPQDVHRVFKNLANQVQNLYRHVAAKFQEYDKKLLQFENNYTEIAKDFFSRLFSKETESRKNNLMGGVELREDLPHSSFGDYSKEQQIEFTCEYIVNILPQIVSMGEYSHSVKKYLLHYGQIMKVSLVQLGDLSFADFVKLQLSK